VPEYDFCDSQGILVNQVHIKPDLRSIGKTAGGQYHPFLFERTVNTVDAEISEEMFIITKAQYISLVPGFSIAAQ
jgi:hypothetical protein